MKQDVRYILMDPTGNRTLLVLTPVPVPEQPAVAARLMETEPTAEQAGFLSDGTDCDIALRMAGGEFCGNAAMCAAVYHGICAGLTAGTVRVRVSGAPEPIAVRIEAAEDGMWRGEVEMPRPLEIRTVRFADGQTSPVVFFPGIAHILLTQTPDRQAAEQTAKRRCAELRADAVGLMFLDFDAGTLTPLVYVPAADTLFWENACGSGTSAVGAFLARERNENVCVSLRQPGGVLTVCASPDGTIRLKGVVRLLHDAKKG